MLLERSASHPTRPQVQGVNPAPDARKHTCSGVL